MPFLVRTKGLAVRGQRGGAALFQDRAHRACPQALHGELDGPCAPQRSEGGRGLDGPVQESRLHGLECSATGRHEEQARESGGLCLFRACVGVIMSSYLCSVAVSQIS